MKAMNEDNYEVRLETRWLSGEGGEWRAGILENRWLSGEVGEGSMPSAGSFHPPAADRRGDWVGKGRLRLKAMTLTELLVVLAILGILVLMAFPVVMPLFQRARSTEAKIQLKHLCTLQKTYYLEHAKYSKDLKAIGFQQAQLELEGGTAHYKIEVVEAAGSSFLGRATSITDFDGDGQMNIWEVDQTCQPREVVED